MSENNLYLKKKKWTVSASTPLYGLHHWGDNYFSINDNGHINVSPKKSEGSSLDLLDLVNELESRNLKTPLLIRFDDILEDRLTQLHKAFANAIHQYNYTGEYQGVFPIKCNQHRQVVEE